MRTSTQQFCLKKNLPTTIKPLCLLCGLAISAPAFTAEPPSDSKREETLVVTARKVKEDPLKVPISMTLFDRQTLGDRRIDDVEHLIRDVPNISFSSLGDMRSTYMSIRGVGPMAQPLGFDDTSVVTYIDGVPQPAFGSDLRFLDIERIEVLRGPQGTVFGRNAQAGAINITTRQPGDTFEGKLRVEAGLNSESENVGQLTVSGPLIEDRLGGRFSAAYSNLGADVDNNAPGGKLGKVETGVFRGSLVFTPDDRTRFVLTGNYERDNNTPSNFILKNGPNFPTVEVTPKGLVDREISGLSLNASRQFDRMQFTSVSAVNHYDFKNLTNNSEALTFSKVFGMPTSAFIPATDWSTYDENQNSLYQELRLSSLDDADIVWVGGINYLHDSYKLTTKYNSAFFSSTNGTRNGDYTTNSYAAFGEVTVPLFGSEKLKGTLGGRYTHDRKTYESLYRSNGFPGTVTSFNQSGVLNYDMVTGRVALSYDLTDDSTIYTSVARGAKSGGFPNFTNNAPSGLKDDPYEDSSSWSYEIGSKNRFLDGRVELNASLFYNTVKDENLFAMDSASFTFVPKPMDTRNYGVELEGSLQLAEHWKVSGGAGYTHTELRNVSDDVAASSGARDGNRIPAIPKFNTNLTLQYYDSAAWLGLPEANIFALAQHQYVGSREADVGSHFKLDAYQLYNAKVGLEFTSFDVYVFGQNLTDERPQYIGLYYGPGSEAVTVGHGRVLGVGTQIKF
ncbi:TonB-dependent receptor [Salmonella enterica subsp. diarizonae]|nr:TonB-dependent receptor [Salmonella enterica subsp. diarizonae]ECQ1024563.1 TonB-dependent receptor [Salmonella enterica subsp. diarizonae]EDE1922933.1 TonB-dependent receptor [Salmonella enterica subsp. diarizonae]